MLHYDSDSSWKTSQNYEQVASWQVFAAADTLTVVDAIQELMSEVHFLQNRSTETVDFFEVVVAAEIREQIDGEKRELLQVAEGLMIQRDELQTIEAEY